MIQRSYFVFEYVTTMVPHFPQSWNYFFFWLCADFSSCWGHNKGLGKEGFRGDDLRWCRPLCMQLCLLPFPSVCRAKRDQIALCSCSSVLDHRWGHTNAICCFLVRGAHFIKLAVHHHPTTSVCQRAWSKS